MLVSYYIDGVATPFDEIKNLLNTIRNDTSEHYKEFRSIRAQMESNLKFLRDDLTSLNDSVSNFSMSLQEHTQTEMTSVNTSFNSTQASQASHTLHIHQVSNKLDTLNMLLIQQ